MLAKLELSVLLLTAVFLAGCGGEDAAGETFTVSGGLHAGGDPIGGVGLGFFATDSNFIGGAETDEGGHYSAELPAGQYIVTVALPVKEVQETPGSPPNEVEVEDDRVPDSVRVKTKSPIKIVVEGDMPDVDLDLNIH